MKQGIGSDMRHEDFHFLRETAKWNIWCKDDAQQFTPAGRKPRTFEIHTQATADSLAFDRLLATSRLHFLPPLKRWNNRMNFWQIGTPGIENFDFDFGFFRRLGRT